MNFLGLLKLMVQKINPHPAPGCNRSPPTMYFQMMQFLGVFRPFLQRFLPMGVSEFAIVGVTPPWNFLMCLCNRKDVRKTMLQSWHFFEAFPSIDEEGGDKLGAFGAAIASVVIVVFCDLSSLMSVTLTSSRKVLSSPINKKKKRDDKAKSQFFTIHTNIGSLITFKWSN